METYWRQASDSAEIARRNRHKNEKMVEYLFSKQMFHEEFGRKI